jgi:hypothetical protein
LCGLKNWVILLLGLYYSFLGRSPIQNRLKFSFVPYYLVFYPSEMFVWFRLSILINY